MPRSCGAVLGDYAAVAAADAKPRGGEPQLERALLEGQKEVRRMQGAQGEAKGAQEGMEREQALAKVSAQRLASRVQGKAPFLAETSTEQAPGSNLVGPLKAADGASTRGNFTLAMARALTL